MIREIKDWTAEFLSVELDYAIYNLGYDVDEGNIYLILHISFYEELKQKYTLEDLDIKSLKKRNIVIKVDGSIIYCDKVIPCKECEHLEKCYYCVTKKLIATEK